VWSGVAGPKLVYVSKHDGAPTMKTRNAEGLVDDGRGSGLRARAVIPGGVAIMRWGWRRRYFAGVGWFGALLVRARAVIARG